MRKPETYLEHMLSAIDNIQSYMEGTYYVEDFVANAMLKDAVVCNLQVVGEASNQLMKRFPEFVKEHPELPLVFAYQMRNALSHGYFSIDYEMVWDTVSADLPPLRSQLLTLLDEQP